jgi:hypothetical protein
MQTKKYTSTNIPVQYYLDNVHGAGSNFYGMARSEILGAFETEEWKYHTMYV